MSSASVPSAGNGGAAAAAAPAVSGQQSQQQQQLSKNQRKRLRQKEAQAAAAAAAASGAGVAGSPAAASPAAAGSQQPQQAQQQQRQQQQQRGRQGQQQQQQQRGRQQQQQSQPQQQHGAAASPSPAAAAASPSPAAGPAGQAGAGDNNGGGRKRRNRRNRRNKPAGAQGQDQAGEDDGEEEDADAPDVQSTPIRPAVAAAPATPQQQPKQHQQQQQSGNRGGRGGRQQQQQQQAARQQSNEVELLRAQVANLQRELEQEKSKLAAQQKQQVSPFAGFGQAPFPSTTASSLFSFTSSSAAPAAAAPATATPAFPAVSPFGSGSFFPSFTPSGVTPADPAKVAAQLFPSTATAANTVAFLPRPPEMVPFVPVVAPLPPEQLETVNSGASSHSDTDSEFEPSESEEEEEEGEDEDDEEEGSSGSGSGSGSEEDYDDEEEEEEEDHSESETVEQLMDGSSRAGSAGGANSADKKLSAAERTGLSKRERKWLKRFAASLDNIAQAGQQAQQAQQKGGKGRGRGRRNAPPAKKAAAAASLAVSLAQVQAGVIPASIAREQLTIEAQHHAELEALSRTPLLEPQVERADPATGLPIGSAASLRPGGDKAAPRNSAPLQSFVHAYILGLLSEAHQGTRRIETQIKRFKRGEDEGEDDEDEEGEHDEDAEEDAEDEEEEEDAEEEHSGDEHEDDEEEDEDAEGEDTEDDDEAHSSEDGLHKFMRGLHKKNPKTAAAARERKRREAKAAQAKNGAVDAADVTLEDVENDMAALALGAAAAPAAALAAAAAAAFPDGELMVPVAHSAEEAARMSHSQVTSPSPNDAHHAGAHHKHHGGAKHSDAATAAEAAEAAKPHAHMHRADAHRKHPKKQAAEPQRSAGGRKGSHAKSDDGDEEEEHDADVEDDEEEDEDEEDEDEEDEEDDDEHSGYASEHSGSGSGSGSGSHRSSASRTSSTSSWQDALPYEKNLFSLAPSYHFIKRLYSCADAVTYKALSKLTGRMVAIKICDGYDSSGATVPKEVRLLNRAQGHGNVCVFQGWHPFPANGCYAIITEYIVNEPIETLFDQPALQRIYMRDMLRGLQHLHNRGIIFRDLKPSNCLWNAAERKAVVIDFDVGSYFDAKNLHRSMVGTDGHMAPEMLHIKYAKRRHLPLPYKGYGLEVDVYAAGMVLGQLLFQTSENDVADLGNPDAKGDAFVQRVLELSTRGEATLAHHLLVQMLHPEPSKRITVEKALAHPWLAV